MFFYDLPRFSVDLDFNLLDTDREDLVYLKVRKILQKYGSIYYEAKKYFGPLVVLNYGQGERKLKVEISNRVFENRYEIRNLLGINVKVMVQEDLFAHKLCALLDRTSITNRDIFDCWFFMDRRTPINKNIVESRMKMPLSDYIQNVFNIRLDKNLSRAFSDLKIRNIPTPFLDKLKNTLLKRMGRGK